MPCSEWENLISEYHDGELPQEDRARVERHMFECKSCAEFFRAMKADADAVTAAFDMPRVCPKAFAERVMARIKRPARSTRRIAWIAVAAAACLAVAFIASASRGIGTVSRITDRTGLAINHGAELQRRQSVKSIAAGTAIKPGDAIQAGADSLVYVRLKTGDEVVVNRGSSALFPGRDQAHRQVIAVNKGDVFVRAVRGKGSLEVQTPAGKAEVIGTQFSVSFDSAAAQAALTVCEGKVRFHNPRGEQIVGAGYQSMASATAGPSAPVAVDAASLTAWADPPSAARLAQVAAELVRSLKARVIPAKDLFEAGEPIYATVQLTNSGREPVSVSQGLFVGREDTAVQRAQYKLSQVMLTKVFGTDLDERPAALPAPKLVELNAGDTWQTRVCLSSRDELPALRTIQGPGAYSVAVAFPVARRLPGAPDDSMVWADVNSDSTIVRVISVAAPMEGQPVAGLQLALSAKAPGCRLGKDLGIEFDLKGVTSDQIAISTKGLFQLRIEPATFGMLNWQPADGDMQKKLEMKLAELKLDAAGTSPRQLLGALADRGIVNVLADRAALNAQAVELQPQQTLSENLQAVAAASGATLETGRSAIWLLSGAASQTADLAQSLEKIKGNDQGWIKLKGVDSREGELALATGREIFPRPGLYRCTVEYANKNLKTGADWPAAWLGSVKSSPIVIAVLEPQPPAELADHGLRLRIAKAEPAPGGKKVSIRLELRNETDQEIALQLNDALTVRDELLVYDVLNPDCYDRPDPATLRVLENNVALQEEEIDVASLLKKFADSVGTFDGVGALKQKKVLAMARQVSIGEVLEYLARSNNVSFLRTGRRQYLAPAGSPLPDPVSVRPDAASGTTPIRIPARASHTIALSAPIGQTGDHRIQVGYLHTGSTAGEQKVWTGNALSDPVILEIE